jgi:hypothetical protein
VRSTSLAAMRLNAELISLGQVVMNAIRERQLSLRGFSFV